MACIMLVEDDPSIVALLHSMFQKEGYEILEAKDGQAALEKLGLGSAPAVSLMPDVIILDIMMPVMDGFTLNSRLQDFPTAKDLPVIVLTAKGQKMRDLFQSSPNVAAYVQKPFDPKMLRDLIAGILARTK